MRSTTLKRIEALEHAKKAGGYNRVHKFSLEHGENADDRIAALCASGEATEDDLFIVLTFVDPPPRDDRLWSGLPAGPSHPLPKEYALHKAVEDHLRAFADPSWRWGHYPAGEKRDPRTAAKLKVMGVQRGWPDFLFFAPAGENTPAGLRARLKIPSVSSRLRWFRVSRARSAATGLGQSRRHLGEALAVLSSWGVLRRPVAGLGRVRG